MTKADPEFVCLCIYQWSGERRQNILDNAKISSDDRKKWEIHLRQVEEQCKPRGSKLVAATQYQVLTEGDMILPEYIEKCRQITDACGWLEDAKDSSREHYSPRSKESKSLSKVFGRRPGLAYRHTSDRNCNSLVQQRLSKINYADSQYSNCSSNCNTARINTDSQSANKASKRVEINGVVKSKQDV